MDLVDLFVGSEGTLGVITSVTLRVLEERPAVCLALVPFGERRDALAFAGKLRQAATTTWRTKDPHGVDISGIEHLDRRCLTLLRDEGADRANGVVFEAETAMALLVALELPPGTRREDAFDQIGRACDPEPPDTPLVRFCRLLADAGVMKEVEIAVPGDPARAAQLMAIREAVPTAVNRRIGQGKQEDPRIEKTAGDIVVPFERVEEMLDFCAAELGGRGLDAAVWGHVSDGNLHPNVLPRSHADVESGRAAMLAIGREAMRLGGAPLAEHGVGRNPIKQRLLNELYGDAGVEDMRRVKRAIDPRWKLAPGVLFARPTS
jgi:D-lactate dehydrogenase (cytochrome)